MSFQSRPPVAVEVAFPAALQPLFRPKRYKVMYGGRGASRSWSCARALLSIGKERSIRVLCVRELQKSIADSVHKLLSDQIDLLGLSWFYDIQVGKIVGLNGTVFSFEGIKNNTKAIKSYEGIDYCWVEEADGVSKASWNILTPTIRKTGSEIWITFNPGLETDYTYVRFVKDPALKKNSDFLGEDGKPLFILESDLSFVIKMNWRDNPWFPQTLLADMELDKRTDPDMYLNVWEGHCLVNLEGAVLAKELRQCLEDGRICEVPYDREFPVKCFWDLGHSDAAVCWFVQQINMQIRIIDFWEMTGGYTEDFVLMLQEKRYFYEQIFLPHDAAAKNLRNKRTVEQQFKDKFPDKVTVLGKVSVLDGINACRLILPNCYFDEENCQDGLDGLRHWRYKLVNGQRMQNPEHSDIGDAFKYLALGLKSHSGTRGSIDRVKNRLGNPGEESHKGGILGRLSNIPAGMGWLS